MEICDFSLREKSYPNIPRKLSKVSNLSPSLRYSLAMVARETIHHHPVSRLPDRRDAGLVSITAICIAKIIAQIR